MTADRSDLVPGAPAVSDRKEHAGAAIDDLLRREEVSRLDEDVSTTAEMLRTEQAVVAWRDRRAELQA